MKLILRSIVCIAVNYEPQDICLRKTFLSLVCKLKVGTNESGSRAEWLLGFGGNKM